MYAFQTAPRATARSLAAIVASVALLLATPAISHAEEANPNTYSCLGHISGGKPEAGSEEQQVRYTFYCNGPITGYQLQAQIPVTGVQSPPLVVSPERIALADTFSCSGDIPGWALNCVGSAKAGYESITGQFAIGTKLCAEPRVDPLLTVTYAYLEKGVVTQAISGPFDLGRPSGCRPDAFSGGTRLNPKPLTLVKGKHKGRGNGRKGKGKGPPRLQRAARGGHQSSSLTRSYSISATLLPIGDGQDEVHRETITKLELKARAELAS